jgi:hypothetical protein
MSATSATNTTSQPFTASERRTLRALRARYSVDHDRFSTRELERLSFLRWLYQTGRITP